MNVEELVQDVILSLLGELPPMKKVKDIKARTKAIEIITNVSRLSSGLSFVGNYTLLVC